MRRCYGRLIVRGINNDRTRLACRAIAKAELGRLASAALTILRAWHAVDTLMERSPLGGFAPLLWL
jgi:hypothetical protein